MHSLALLQTGDAGLEPAFGLAQHICAAIDAQACLSCRMVMWE